MTALIRVRAGAPSWLLALLALGLFVRAVTILALPPHTWFEGGDGPYYARQAWFIAHGRAVDPMHTIGPLYPLMLATAWRPFAHDAEPPPPSAVPAAFLTTVRLAQALIGVLTAGLVYLLARRLGQSRGSAAVGVVGVSLGPAFVIEPFLIRTETLSILLLTGAVLLYVRRPSTWPGIIATGVTCGLAALARPVLLLFPVAFALAHLAGAEQARRGREAAALLAAALLTVAPWHAWLHTTHGRWLPAGFSANLLHGAYDDGGPPNPATFHAIEQRAAEAGRGILGEAAHQIAQEPAAWMMRRAGNLAAALAQPHGTSDLGGPSIRHAMLDWLRGARSADTLGPIVLTWGFALRGLTYAFHYLGLVLAGVGLYVSRKDWRAWLPVYAAIAYILGVHAVLAASPRYLFPIQPFVWVLAGAAVSQWKGGVSQSCR